MLRLITVLSLLVCFSHPLASNADERDAVQAEQQVEKDPLEMFRPYVGKWHSTIQGKKTEYFPEAYETATNWEGRFVLNGTMYECRGSATLPDGTEYSYVWQYAFNARESTIVCWYHDSLGNHIKHHATWSEERKVLTLIPVDPEGEHRFQMIMHDPEQLRFQYKMFDKNGKLILHETGTAEQIPDE